MRARCPRSWWSAPTAQPVRDQVAQLARALAFQLRHQPDGRRARGHRRAAVHGLARGDHAVQGHRARLLAHRAVLRRAAGRAIVNVFWNMLARQRQCRHRRDAGERARQPDGGLRHSLEFADRQLAVRHLLRRYIGEDESSYMPAKYLAQFGLEVWKPTGRRRSGAGIRRIRHHHLFGEHQSAGRTTTAPTTRADSTSRAIATTAASSATPPTATPRTTRSARPTPTADGELWTATARTSRLNRDDFDDVRNTVASGPDRLRRAGTRLARPLVRRSMSTSTSASNRIEPEGGERETQALRLHRLDARIRAVSMRVARRGCVACWSFCRSLASPMPIRGSRRATKALRSDIQLLADAGILRGPVTTWPIVVARYRARRAGRERSRARSRPPREALLRVQRLSRAASALRLRGRWDSRQRRVRADTLRDFADTPREEGEARAARQLAQRSLRAEPAGFVRRRSR